jgi:hypothetical protein
VENIIGIRKKIMPEEIVFKCIVELFYMRFGTKHFVLL